MPIVRRVRNMAQATARNALSNTNDWDGGDSLDLALQPAIELLNVVPLQCDQSRWLRLGARDPKSDCGNSKNRALMPTRPL